MSCENITIDFIEDIVEVEFQGAIVNIASLALSVLESSIMAGENISANKVIRNDISNMAFVADSTDVADTNRVIGISKVAVSTGVNLDYIVSGILTDSLWNWDVTKPIFFDVNGDLTQVVPVTGFSQVVAIPVTDKIINVTIKQAIKLI